MSENEHQVIDNEIPDDPLTTALRSMSFQQAVDSLGMDAIKNAILDKFTVYDQGRKNIEGQLAALREKVSKDNIELVHRVDRLIALMTNNAAFIRQMIDLLDNYGEKLAAYEKDAIKHQMEYAAVVERMNRMANSFAKLENNQREIVEEMEGLIQRQDEDDKFKWKLITIVSIVGGLLGWLCMSDNLKNFIIFVQKSLFGE